MPHMYFQLDNISKWKKILVSKNFLFPSYTESIINTLCPNNQIISHSFLGEAYPYPTMLLWKFIRHTHNLLNLLIENFISVLELNLLFAHKELLGAGAGDVVPESVRPAHLHAVLHLASCGLAAATSPPVGPGAAYRGGQEEVRRRSGWGHEVVQCPGALTWRRWCRRSRSRWPPWPRRCRPASRCCC